MEKTVNRTIPPSKLRSLISSGQAFQALHQQIQQQIHDLQKQLQQLEFWDEKCRQLTKEEYVSDLSQWSFEWRVALLGHVPRCPPWSNSWRVPMKRVFISLRSIRFELWFMNVVCGMRSSRRCNRGNITLFFPPTSNSTNKHDTFTSIWNLWSRSNRLFSKLDHG